MARDDRPLVMVLVLALGVLLVASWPALASAPAVTYLDGSSPSRMVPLELCTQELSRLEQMHDEQLTRLESDWRTRLSEATTEAAAAAVAPVMEELRVVEAQRDRALASVRSWRGATVVAGLLGIVATLVAVLVAGEPPP